MRQGPVPEKSESCEEKSALGRGNGRNSDSKNVLGEVSIFLISGGSSILKPEVVFTHAGLLRLSQALSRDRSRSGARAL